MEIAAGNLYKPLELTLSLKGVAFALIEETDDIKLRWIDPNGDAHEVEPDIVDGGTTGELTYDFVVGETDVEGYYQGQVTVTRDNKPLSFPDDGTFFMWLVTPKV